MRENPMRYQVVLAALFISIWPSHTAFADKIYIVEPQGGFAATVAELTAARPDLSVEAIEAFVTRRMLAIPELKTALSPAPLMRDARGAYFQGEIIEFFEGLHGANPTERNNHDRVLFRAYGPGGRNLTRNPTLIHGDVVTGAVHEFDTPIDFVAAFSDRHLRLGTSFGSREHKSSIYRLVDPGGDLMLFRGGGRISGNIAEGRVTDFLLNGPKGFDTFFRLGAYLHLDARNSWMLAPSVMPRFPNDVGGGQVMPMHVETGDLLFALARARQYPAIYSDIVSASEMAIDILCMLGRADPGISPPNIEATVRRARQVGFGCLQTILSAISTVPGFWQDQNNTLLPIDAETGIETALDLIAKGDSFRFFTGAEFMDQEPVNINPYRYFGRFDNFSFQIFHKLAEIAAGADPAGNKPTLAAKAELALMRMITKDAGGEPDIEEFLKTDQRYFRSILYASLLPFEKDLGFMVPLAHRALCRSGWGDAIDLIQLVESLLGFDRSIHDESVASKLGPSNTYTEAYLVQLRRLSNDRAEQYAPIARLIDDHIDELRKLNDEGFGTDEIRTFLERFDKEMGNVSLCERI